VPTSSGGLTDPQGLAFGPRGDLFVSSIGTGSVLEYSGRTGAFVTTFVPSGSGGLSQPTYLTFGPAAAVPDPDPTFGPAAAVPEPSSAILLGTGLAGIVFWRRKLRHSAQTQQR
jgi:hypothetical protein